MMNMYRQGDVLLIPAKLPANAVQRKITGDVILAYGEVTGHAHRIAVVDEGPERVQLWDAGAERFLRVLETTALTHEEHAPVALPPGVYYLPQQVEYTPQEIHRVAD
jgi:hypothetical protein